MEPINVAYVLNDVITPVDEFDLDAFELKFAKDRTCKGMLLHHV